MTYTPQGQRAWSRERLAKEAMVAPVGGAKLTGGYYHGRLRSKPSERVEVMPAGRRCVCGKKLAELNRSDACYSCQKAGRR